VSCSDKSTHALANTSPEHPPIVNIKIKPNDHVRGANQRILPPIKVASQENTFMPVGTAIIIVALVKYAFVLLFKPMVYIWWAHTTKPMKPIAAIANNIPLLPNNSVLPLK
jgi:hypothetical protein